MGRCFTTSFGRNVKHAVLWDLVNTSLWLFQALISHLMVVYPKGTILYLEGMVFKHDFIIVYTCTHMKAYYTLVITLHNELCYAICWESPLCQTGYHIVCTWSWLSHGHLGLTVYTPDLCKYRWVALYIVHSWSSVVLIHIILIYYHTLHMRPTGKYIAQPTGQTGFTGYTLPSSEGHTINN